MTPEELKRLEWKHNVLPQIFPRTKHESITTFANSDTSQESLDKSIEIYNQKQWWEL